ncbi:hypothetical protein [Reticulibacter mediterranei]|uniref:hypothetical protein n=1 Tax=Reticulibacter mediterranei TaxID=2778369 RepID=UPI001C690207|nr:hypothetical protein [Reticulibacter mediterranei]
MRRWHHVEPRKPAMPGLRGKEVRTAIAVAMDHPSWCQRRLVQNLERTHKAIVTEKTGYRQSSPTGFS